MSLLEATVGLAVDRRERDDVGMAAEEDEGGEPACWMHMICPTCGLLTEEDPPPAVCPRCGEERPEAS